MNRKQRHISLLLFVFLMASQWGNAQASIDNYFQKLPSPQYELLSNTITSIVQDDEIGFIWVGTRKGLFFYNGTEYRDVKTVNKALSSALRLDITKLCFDHRGWLWIGTYKGVLVYDPQKDAIVEIDNTHRLRNVIIRDFFPSSSGDVLIGSRNHLFTYSDSTKRIEEVTPNLRDGATEHAPYFFYSFCEGGDSTIWLSSSYGLLNFDNKNIDYNNYTFYPYQQTLGTSVLAKQQILLKNTPEGNLLLGSDKGLYLFDLKKKELSPFAYTINTPYSKIRALTFDHKDRLWIGTLNGILVTEKWDEPTVLSYNAQLENCLSDDRIYTLFADKNNTVWVGTSHGGVNYWSEQRALFKHISDKGSKSISHKTVNCIREDNKGQIYFGVEKKGVGIYDPTKKEFEQLFEIDGQFSLGFVDMSVSDRTIWLATLSGGLVAYDPLSGRSKRYLIDKNRTQTDISFSNHILSIIQDSEHTLLVGTFHQGLNRFDIKTGTFTKIPLEGFHSPQRILPAVQKIVQNTQGIIYVLAQDDIYRLEKDLSSPHGYKTTQFFNGEVEDGWINDLCVTKAGDLWFSCPQGSVYRYANGQKYKIELGEDVEVLTILEGEDHGLWMSTTLGVIYYNYKTQVSYIFDERMGLEKNEFLPRAGLRSQDGTIYFGGASGISSFNSLEVLKSSDDSLKTLITGLLVYNNALTINDSTGVLQQPIAYTKALTLSPKQNMFTLSFAPEDYSLWGRNSFEYRLLGFNDQWIKTSSSRVTYTLQSGGDYTFEVRYLNAQGLPSPYITQLKIELLDPFWKTNLAYVLYVLVFLLVSWWLFSLYSAKTKLKHQLAIDTVEYDKQQELNEQKLRFFTNISHDFRTPLTLIIGSIEQFVQKFPLSSEMHQMLQGVQKNSHQLMTLINDLMDFRKLENKQTNLSVSERDIVSFVHDIFLSFNNQAETKKFHYNFNPTVEELMVYFDAPKIERVIYNLLSNAFKFTDNGGHITLSIVPHPERVEIIVKDSGCGIAHEHLAHIFDRFYEVKGASSGFMQGTGIGLTIAKNFVELHHGQIAVESQLEKGSTFTISLPLGQSHFSPSDIVALQSDLEVLKQSQQVLSVDENRRIKAIVDDVLHQKDKKHSILITEDDEDLGQFLKETLRDYFNVRLEVNGLKAYQSVLSDPPDLIISDVMMPIMNGTEFCHKVKTNPDTNHIPFIMLTARTAMTHKFEGLESGADEYLSKPFQIKELLLKCANILKTQDNFRQHFMSADSSQDSNGAGNKPDDYTKALKILNANIANDAFGVNDLCQEMGLSRSVLYAKIKEWTGQSPGELMLGFRMKKAGTLLEQQKYTVAEVAAKVGYKQATYFTKCFKNYYKMLPSEYVKKYCK